MSFKVTSLEYYVTDQPVLKREVHIVCAYNDHQRAGMSNTLEYITAWHVCDKSVRSHVGSGWLEAL